MVADLNLAEQSRLLQRWALVGGRPPVSQRRRMITLRRELSAYVDGLNAGRAAGVPVGNRPTWELHEAATDAYLAWRLPGRRARRKYRQIQRRKPV